jgi:hypothetical protein
MSLSKEAEKKYYKYTFDDLEQIINDDDYDKCINDNSYFEKLIQNEKKYLEDQGILLYMNGSNFIVVTDNNLHFKYINTFNVSQCDKNGKSLMAQDITNLKNKTKIIVEYLKTQGVRYYDIVLNKNYIKFACPICDKSEMKCCIGIKSLNVVTFSHSDCNNEKHWIIWDKWKNDIRTLENPDFTNVKWDEDFVNVTYKNLDGDKVNSSLKKYNESYPDYEERPKILKFQILDVIENVKCVINHYFIKCRFNEIKLNYEINDKPLSDMIVYIWDMCKKHHFRISIEHLEKYLILICKEYKYNPIEEYLKKSHEYYSNNKNDNIFDELLKTIKTDSKNKNEYIYKFLLQMVYIGCNSNDKLNSAQFILVLQGDHGLQKTTWFQNLIPKSMRLRYWLGGRSLDANNKDDILEMMSVWLCECGEIAGTFKKSDQEAMKNFITRTLDKVRPPYAKEAIDKVRNMILCATTNDIEYLRDTTGNRRYLTLINCQCNAYHDIDLDMLWGYIYSKYLNNEPYYFDNDKIKIINDENRNYVITSEIISEVESKFDLFPDNNMGEWLTASQICEELPYINKFKLGRELKANNVKFKTGHKKMVSYYLKRL